MTKLKLGSLHDNKPVKLSVELPSSVHRDLVAYGELLARSNGAAKSIEPARLIAPMRGTGHADVDGRTGLRHHVD
jgi:hypothetical protein